jgi:hypothetical protein
MIDLCDRLPRKITAVTLELIKVVAYFIRIGVTPSPLETLGEFPRAAEGLLQPASRWIPGHGHL